MSKAKASNGTPADPWPELTSLDRRKVRQATEPLPLLDAPNGDGEEWRGRHMKVSRIGTSESRASARLRRRRLRRL